MGFHQNNYSAKIAARTVESYDLPETLEASARGSLMADYTTIIPSAADSIANSYFALTEKKLSPEEATREYGLDGDLAFNEPITASGAKRRREKTIWQKTRVEIMAQDEKDNGLMEHMMNASAMIAPLAIETAAQIAAGGAIVGGLYSGISSIAKIANVANALNKIPMAAKVLSPAAIEAASMAGRRLNLAGKLEGLEVGIRDLALGVRTAPHWAVAAGDVALFNGLTELAVYNYAEKYGLDYDRGQAALYLGLGILAGGVLGQVTRAGRVSGKYFKTERSQIEALTSFTDGILENARISKEGYLNLLSSVSEDLAKGRIPNPLSIKALMKADVTNMAYQAFKEALDSGQLAKVITLDEVDQILKNADFTGLDKIRFKAAIGNAVKDFVATEGINIKGLSAGDRAILKKILGKDVGQMTVADIKKAIKDIQDPSSLRALGRQKEGEIVGSQIEELLRQLREDLNENFYNPEKIKGILSAKAEKAFRVKHEEVVSKIEGLQARRLKEINLKRAGYKRRVAALEAEITQLMDEFEGSISKTAGINEMVGNEMSRLKSLQASSKSFRRDYIQNLKLRQKENVAGVLDDVLFNRQDVMTLEKLGDLLNAKLAQMLNEDYSKALTSFKKQFDDIVANKNLEGFRQQFKDLVKTLKDKKVQSLEQYFRLRPETRQQIAKLMHMVSAEKLEIDLQKVLAATDEEIEFFFGNHVFKSELDEMTLGQAMKHIKERVLDPEAIERAREAEAAEKLNKKLEVATAKAAKGIDETELNSIKQAAAESNDPELAKAVKEIDQIDADFKETLSLEAATEQAMKCLLNVG